jgi:predicted dehydrogenase
VDTKRRENAKKKVEEFYTAKSGQSYKGCSAYADFREILSRKDIDAVVIATPDHWHALIATAAAAANKDIYCEKPLCQSIHEARAMVNAVRKNNRVFQTGSMQRSSFEFRTAVELIRNGRIGKITTAEVAVGGPAIPCDLPAEESEPGLDWNMWLGPAPLRAYNSVLSPRGVHDNYPNWRRYREYGGGGVTDWGAHHFDIVQWALDMDDSGPVEILPPPQANAKSGVKLVYANGTTVVHASGNGITFSGTEGKIYVNRGKFQVWIGSQQVADSVADIDRVTTELLGGSSQHVYKSKDHKRDWLEAIGTRKPPICDVEVGARTVSVCHLVNLAYYHGKKLKWDPKSEMFVDGTGDPKWLDVAYRGPWKLS